MVRVEISGINRHGDYESRTEIIALGKMSFTEYALIRGWDYVSDHEYTTGNCVIILL